MGERQNWIARFVAYALTHWCGTVTLCQVERAILNEAVKRERVARKNMEPSPAQLAGMSFVDRFRMRHAYAKLRRRLDSWKFEARKKR